MYHKGLCRLTQGSQDGWLETFGVIYWFSDTVDYFWQIEKLQSWPGHWETSIMTWPIMTWPGQYSQFLRCLKTRICKVCRICLDNLTNLASVIIVGDRAQVSWHWHALVSQPEESWSGSQGKVAEVEEIISTSDYIRQGSIQEYWP